MMNVEVEFIQVDEAISQLRAELDDKNLLGNTLKNQGFLKLELYIKNCNGNLSLVDKLTKSEFYNLIAKEYPIKNLDDLKLVSRNNSKMHFLIGQAPVFSRLLGSNSELPYYWRADDFYKKLGANKETGKTVVFYANQITSDEQKELLDKKLQSELAETKANLVEQEQQVQATNNEIATLKTQLDQAHARIAELENQLTQKSTTNERTESSYLITIGLLLELLKTPKGFDKDNKPNKPLFDSNNQIIQDILDYKIYGQGKSTLESRFSEANKVLDQAKKR